MFIGASNIPETFALGTDRWESDGYICDGTANGNVVWGWGWGWGCFFGGDGGGNFINFLELCFVNIVSGIFCNISVQIAI